MLGGPRGRNPRLNWGWESACSASTESSWEYRGKMEFISVLHIIWTLLSFPQVKLGQNTRIAQRYYELLLAAISGHSTVIISSKTKLLYGFEWQQVLCLPVAWLETVLSLLSGRSPTLVPQKACRDAMFACYFFCRMGWQFIGWSRKHVWSDEAEPEADFQSFPARTSVLQLKGGWSWDGGHGGWCSLSVP